jgi:hypothetical protein
MYVSLVVVHPRCEQITKPYPTQKLGPNTIGDCIDYLTTILSRVDVHAERSFAKWHVDNLDDGVSDTAAATSASSGIQAEWSVG